MGVAVVHEELAEKDEENAPGGDCFHDRPRVNQNRLPAVDGEDAKDNHSDSLQDFEGNGMVKSGNFG